MKRRFRLNWGRGAKLKVERLLEGGIDVDDPVDTFGYTLLHHAVELEVDAEQTIRDESETITTLLLDRGANINILDCCGRTPLMLAALSLNVKAVKILLERGSVVTSTCKFGKTVLHYTALNPGTEIASMIVDKGGPINKLDFLEENALEEAIEIGNNRLAKFLEGLGAEKKCTKTNNVTELHRAVFWGREKEVVRLLVNNVDLECKDMLGNTPLITAVRSGQFNIVKLLLDSGANVLAEDNLGDSVLHWACKQCLGDIVRLVLQYGGSPLSINKAQKTPFDSAVVGIIGECKIPYNLMFTTSPVINHLLDYGFCKHIEANIASPQGVRRMEKDALDTYPPLSKFIVANDLRRSFAGLPLSMSPYIKEVERTFLPKSLKKRWVNMDIIKRKNNPQFYTDCKREIAIMKTISLSNKLSLFDIIIKPIDQVIAFITSETIEHLLVNGDCADDLPIYWGIVQGRLEVLSYRKSLIESSQHLFTFLKPLLPFECVEIILAYLSVNELKCLRSIVQKIELESLS